MEAICNPSLVTPVAEVEIIYHGNVKPSQRPIITSAKDAYKILLALWNADAIEYAEEFKVVFLNVASRVLGVYELSSGGISSTVVDIRMIFAAALKATATGIIVAHNHPSGNLQPSHADVNLTSKIAEAGKLLEIRVLDHLIISPEGYFSFADEGMI